MALVTDIFWRRLDGPGHDACRLERDDAGWLINGMAVFREEGKASALRYQVRSTEDWVTREARISGWSGADPIDLVVEHLAGDKWRMNGTHIGAVKGCKDVDLGFTPATNTLAIRRLDLAPGAHAETTAAWLDPADWTLKPLTQTYTRSGDATYDYTSPAHGFEARLTVDAHGLVSDYPGLWTAEIAPA